MPLNTILITLLALIIFSYFLGRKRSVAVSGGHSGRRNLHSLPSYYGYMVAIWAGIPALIMLALWSAFNSTIVTSMTVSGLPEHIQAQSANELGLIMNEIRNLANSGRYVTEPDPVKKLAAENFSRFSHISNLAKTAVIFIVALIGMALGYRLIKPNTQARNSVETVIRWSMIICASIAILSTVGIVMSVLFESLRFFSSVSPIEFLFGTKWSPQTSIRSDQVGSSGSFGAIPLFVGTLLISLVAKPERCPKYKPKSRLQMVMICLVGILSAQ